MTRKAFTTFAAGRVGAECLDTTMQPMPLGITHVVEISVPEGANPSKFGTWIQRFALDGALPDDATEHDRLLITQAAAQLDDPSAALAVSMAGTAPGEKMRDRLNAPVESGLSPYLVFGLAES
jgi:hypothetical protein